MAMPAAQSLLPVETIALVLKEVTPTRIEPLVDLGLGTEIDNSTRTDPSQAMR